MNRKISIIHPSRERPEIAAQTASLWLNSMENIGNAEYILSIDKTDPTLERYFKLFATSPYCKLLIGDNKTAIEAINAGAVASSNGLIVVISDDFACFKNWDTALMDALVGNTDFLVKTNDTLQDWIITIPIMDRTYYERFGYVYYPGYAHMFADTEMTHVGALLGRTITIPLVFLHQHYSQRGGQPKDAVNEKNDKTWRQGEDLYLSRLKDNFGIKDPLTPNIPAGHKEWLRQHGH